MREMPLTPEQKAFAANNHGLVYKFLNKNQLPEDEFYDVVIFGYLKAIKEYFSKDSLRQYSFATICWKTMKQSLYNYHKSLLCQKRNAETVSIHSEIPNSELPLEETLTKPDELMLQLETELLLHDLASHISRQQMDIIRLKTGGYSIQDIAHIKKIPLKYVKETLEDVQQILMKICYE